MSALETKTCPRCGTLYGPQATFCQLDGSRLELSPTRGEDAFLGRVLLDQFRVDAVLGRGGMGTVYRAHQLTIARDVALKVLNPELARNEEAYKRFQREVRVATAIEHPNVVRVFLFGQLPDGSLYLVMEFLDGVSLAARLDEEPVMPTTRALHILEQIARGLGAAHAKGIVHRDVKPENVLLVRNGPDADFVKLLDFGIARMLDAESSGVTKTGFIFGTARYMSPEGAQGETSDARSDVYSLAVLAYQLFTGETPFDGTTPVALLVQHVQAKPPDLRSKKHGASIPKPIADLVMRSLSKRPADRPVDGNAFADALVRAVAEASSGQGVRALAREDDDTSAFRHERDEPRTGALPTTRSSRGMRVGLSLVGAFVIGLSAAYVVARLRESATSSLVDGGVADASLAATDASTYAPPPIAPSLRITPEHVTARRPFVVEVLDARAGEDVTIAVMRGTRRVEQERATRSSRGTYEARLSISRGGSYVVEALVGDAGVSMPLEIEGPRISTPPPEIFEGSSP